MVEGKWASFFMGQGFGGLICPGMNGDGSENTAVLLFLSSPEWSSQICRFRTNGP